MNPASTQPFDYPVPPHPQDDYLYTHVQYTPSTLFNTYVLTLHPSTQFLHSSTASPPTLASFAAHLLKTTHITIRGDVSNFTATNYFQHDITHMDDDCTDVSNVRLLLPAAHHSAAHVGAPQSVVFTQPLNQSPPVEFHLDLETPLEGVGYQAWDIAGVRTGWMLAECIEDDYDTP